MTVTFSREGLVKTRKVFNLFDERPNPWQLFKQCYPVFYVLLYMLWDSVNRRLLSLVFCVPILHESADLNEQGLPKLRTNVAVLMSYSSYVCHSDEHMPLLLLSFIGFGVWSFGILIFTYVTLWKMGDERHTEENLKDFGYFTNGFEPSYWWWDIGWKRLDQLFMVMITFTNLVPDVKGKLILYAFISGIALAGHCYCHPYDDRNAGLLDLCEVLALTSRFFLFGLISLLLIFGSEKSVTWSIAIIICLALVSYVIFVSLHIGTQLLEHWSATFIAEKEELEADPELFKDLFNKDAAANAAKKMGRLIVEKFFMKGASKCLEKVTARQKSLEKVQLHLEWVGPWEDARAGARDRRGIGRGKGCVARFAEHFIAFFFRMSEECQREQCAKMIGTFAEYLFAYSGNYRLPSRLVDILCVLSLAMKSLQRRGASVTIDALEIEVKKVLRSGHKSINKRKNAENSVKRLTNMTLNKDSIPVLPVSESSKSKPESKCKPSKVHPTPSHDTAKAKKDDYIGSEVTAVSADDLMTLQMFLWRLDVDSAIDLVDAVNNILIQHVDADYKKWFEEEGLQKLHKKEDQAATRIARCWRKKMENRKKMGYNQNPTEKEDPPLPPDSDQIQHEVAPPPGSPPRFSASPSPPSLIGIEELFDEEA
eukprot:gnl/MRDRNA2_/MRDRNA2_86250_c2_seq2.p1 gnl/MRDRNA2_/MRDRNA2_86250_c2~~gnl/MRDRNA2_/MRDRNA2_86250_c2_seq2.p1  ORF type:complete len:719 (-),score=126.59 gnl/MRDRNA2_/MRDRNA2_86250_c2_seq2:166-2121(-)